jgi:Family of unknown function (DUF5519)
LNQRRRELRRYRRVCRLIDRRLDQGRLSEARQLNVEARTLFKRLYDRDPTERGGHRLSPTSEQYDRPMSRFQPLVDEVANELSTWPGVHIERRADGAALVRYGHSVLGRLYLDRDVAELPVLGPEHDELIEHGDAEPAEATSESSGVSHAIHGPADVTAVLELFDRRYRDVRGDDDPYSSTDPE